jgi:uncharacterized membrane protein
LAALTAVVFGTMPAAVGAAPATAGTTPTFTPLGPVDANVLSMSADGRILVGDNIFGGGAFRWSHRDGTQLLGNAGGQVSISRDGTAIVADVYHHGQATAARWRGGTSWRPLDTYPGSTGCPDLSDVYSVSSHGAVVVGLGWDDCKATAFRSVGKNGIESLGSLDGFASRANDVSADGSVIVGWDDAASGARRGARWVNGVESLLSTGVFLGGAETVNPGGSVIVGGDAGVRGKQAYRWTKQGGGELLGKLPGGGSLARAVALSTTKDGKVVVGFSGAQYRDAFVWAKATGMFKLQDYLEGLGVTGMDGWRLDTALAISRDGSTIAGWGVRPDGHVQSWVVEGLPPLAGAAG